MHQCILRLLNQPEDEDSLEGQSSRNQRIVGALIFYNLVKFGQWVYTVENNLSFKFRPFWTISF